MVKKTISNNIRLIALPLSKQSQKPLIYYYAQQVKSNESPSQTSEGYRSPPFLIKRATDLGAKQWNKLGISPENSWKFKIYTMGERFMDKIPFEEWALKTIDPGPIPKSIEKPQNEPSVECQDRSQMIELLYPSSHLKERELMEGLRSSMANCQPYHRKWMKLNILLSPLTLPVAIVPLIPNLPFFYMIWRAWSHWRAYNSSRYLLQMIQHGRVVPVACSILDSLYAKGSTINGMDEKRLGAQQEDRTNSDKSEDSLRSDNEDELLLSQEMVTQLQQKLDLPIESAVEISRGIQQAKLRLAHSSSTIKSDSSNHSSPSL